MRWFRNRSWRRRARRVATVRPTWTVVFKVAAVMSATESGLVLRAGPVLAQVTLTPDSGLGPGGPQLQQLVNWGAGMALIVCVIAMIFHALRWGWGSQQHNMSRVQDGKEGVGRAAMVAGIIGAAAALVNFAVNLGGAVK